MRILHAIQSADPASGGPIEGIRQLAGASGASQDHDLVTLDDPQAPFLANFPHSVAALGPSATLGYSPRLVPWLRKHVHVYDCVVIHGLWRYISVGTWRALRGGPVPYVVMPHGMLDPWFKREYPLKHLKKWLFWPWTEYRVLKDAASVVFTCEEERIRARESFWLYRCNEAVGTQAVARPTGDAETQRNAFLHRHPDLLGKRIILFLGRIHPKKGCDNLIAAFADVAATAPDVHLVMAGPCADDWMDRLKQDAARLGIAHRVIWTGLLSGDLKWGAFHSAEAFILPSHQENFGIAVVEALACGVPVLISDQVQIWREISSGDAGLVDNDNLPGTVRLLRRWMDMAPAERIAMREQARQCFMKNFDIDLARSKLGRLFEQAAAQPYAAPAIP